jgi:hypothetical protein
MFVLLTSKWRRRAAAFVAVLYALCLLVPAAAYAMSDEAVPAHCLTMVETHQAAAEHASRHHDGMSHDDHSKMPASDHDHGLPDKCCGLFSVTAVAPGLDFIAEPTGHVSDVILPAVTSLLGRGAGRIDRPPRHLSAI